ncbi:MAG: hypothetical protein HY822_19875 [Acidobacteria bacterium]|nr:hypothetical protein [Acidobacteriota bacterium]
MIASRGRPAEREQAGARAAAGAERVFDPARKRGVREQVQTLVRVALGGQQLSRRCQQLLKQRDLKDVPEEVAVAVAQAGVAGSGEGHDRAIQGRERHAASRHARRDAAQFGHRGSQQFRAAIGDRPAPAVRENTDQFRLREARQQHRRGHERRQRRNKWHTSRGGRAPPDHQTHSHGAYS